MEKNDGGPAFPNIAFKSDDKGVVYGIRHRGMTLRDYFAAKAMQAYIANGIGAWTNIDTARFSYEIADAMLKSRESHP